MPDPYPLRPVTPEEFRAFYSVPWQAFNASGPMEPELEHDLPTFEFDRSLAAFDRDQMVGTAGACSFQMTVPGAVAAVAGVTAVSVLPTHRRRGILSSMMHRQLADIRDRGEDVAALFSSEAGIYGRYGYGPAMTHLRLAIRRGEGDLLPAAAQIPAARGPAARAPAARAPAAQPTPAGPASLRLADPPDAIKQLAAVYDRVLPRRPGFTARDQRWWESVIWDPEHRRDGAGPLRCVIAADSAGPRGYALYSASGDWDADALPGGVLQVRELMASDSPAYAALWGDLLTRDLVGEVRARLRPADDPLLYLLADPRRARPRQFDGLWIRLTDVPGALSRRRYACGIDVVLDVRDELIPANAGRWRLRAPVPVPGDDEGGRVSCERTSAAADLAVEVRALGAAYLGGTRLAALAGAGLVAELRPGALTAASAAMSWDPAPWCPMMF